MRKGETFVWRGKGAAGEERKSRALLRGASELKYSIPSPFRPLADNYAASRGYKEPGGTKLKAPGIKRRVESNARPGPADPIFSTRFWTVELRGLPFAMAGGAFTHQSI